MTIWDSWYKVAALVEKIVTSKAQEKGYAAGKADGRGTLDEVKAKFPGHAEGEIYYKLLRWQAKRNPEDLLKIMAWAFLIYDQEERNYADKEQTINAGVKAAPPMNFKEAWDRGVTGTEEPAQGGQGDAVGYADYFPGLLRETSGGWNATKEIAGRLSSILARLTEIENSAKKVAEAVFEGKFSG